MITTGSMLVASHDAGGAEVISAYLQVQPDTNRYLVLVAGPAVAVFRRKGINVIEVGEANRERLAELMSGDDITAMLTSIDWSSTLTSQVRREAKRRGLRTIVYLDHWVYYRERLGYPSAGWESAWPDQFWAGDDYSLKLAREFFPDVPVRLEPNRYFEEVKKDFQQYCSRNPNSPQSEALLFISEPMSSTNRAFSTKRYLIDERLILRNFMDDLVRCGFKKKVIIRLHPAETENKYDELIADYRGRLEVEKSFGRSIYEDLAGVSMVVGMESMALVVALLCGQPVISLLPDCSLPFPEIRKVISGRNTCELLTK